MEAVVRAVRWVVLKESADCLLCTESEARDEREVGGDTNAINRVVDAFDWIPVKEDVPDHAT